MPRPYLAVAHGSSVLSRPVSPTASSLQLALLLSVVAAATALLLPPPASADPPGSSENPLVLGSSPWFSSSWDGGPAGAPNWPSYIGVASDDPLAANGGFVAYGVTWVWTPTSTHWMTVAVTSSDFRAEVLVFQHLPLFAPGHDEPVMGWVRLDQTSSSSACSSGGDNVRFL